MDLEIVKGLISSKERSEINVSSEKAKYNYDNQDSKFYKNVIIKYDDKTITCEVYDNRQVKFRDKITTLSRSALIVLNEMGYDTQAVQGAYCWCYKGKSLLDLKNDKG